MHNIHDIKLNFNQNVFISKMQCQMEHTKLKNLNYKPMQEWYVSCAILGKELLPWHPWLLWPWFHPNGYNYLKILWVL